MDLLLTHGYFLYEDKAELRIMKPYPTLGLLYLSSYLKSKGFSVNVFDTTFRSKGEFRTYIDANRPSFVGLYVNLMTKLNVLEQIDYCKKKGCTVIIGGPDVPEYADQYLGFGADVAVIGEGELTMAELLPHLSKHGADRLNSVLGIAFKDGDGKVVRTPLRPFVSDLDALPHPDREAVDVGKYIQTWRQHHGMGSVSLICARGCPFTCTWCSRSVFGESHRRRSVRNVVHEIELIRERYNPDMLWFADDVFTINHKWFNEFYTEMTRRGIRIPFECISRADRVNEDILQKMSELGCFRVWYGSESGSQRVLDAMQRRVSVEQIRSVTKLSQKYGIQVGLFVMLGYPGEEIEDIEATVEHLKATAPDVFTHTVAYPIKGTELYSSVESRISSPGGWESTTDRQLRIRGRRSDQFYWYAIRYLVNEVEYSRARRNGGADTAHTIAAYIKAKAARLGMELTKGGRS